MVYMLTLPALRSAISTKGKEKAFLAGFLSVPTDYTPPLIGCPVRPSSRLLEGYLAGLQDARRKRIRKREKPARLLWRALAGSCGISGVVVLLFRCA